MPALDALTHKAQLLDDLNTRIWRQYIDNMADTLTGRNLPSKRQAIEDGRRGNGIPIRNHSVRANVTGEDFTAEIRRTLDASETFYIAPTMHALVSAAASSMPEDTVVRPEDFPSLQGFLTIPGGITSFDIRGLLTVTDAIAWSVYGGGVNLTYFADKYNPLDRMRPGWSSDKPMPELPRLTPWHFGRTKFGSPLPRGPQLVTAEGTLVAPETAASISFIDRPDGTTAMFWPDGFDLKGARLEEVPEGVSAWLIAALKLMRQPLVSLRDERPDRATSRRMKRVKMPDKPVTVIELRARKGQADRETGREYSHRFLRRGHWRMQWYGPQSDRYQEPIWIHPSIVGDPSLPLIVRQHVTALTR